MRMHLAAIHTDAFSGRLHATSLCFRSPDMADYELSSVDEALSLCLKALLASLDSETCKSMHAS